MKKIVLLCSPILFAVCLSAQVRLTVKSADTLDFILYVNDVQVNNMACLSITLDQLEAVKTNVRMDFPAHAMANFSQVLTLKKNTSVFYQVEFRKGAYKLELVSESTITTVNKPIAEITSSAVAETDLTIAADSIPKEETGNPNCAPVVSNDVFTNALVGFEQVHFQMKKLDHMKNFVIHHCISVEQLRQLMSALSLEDHKLQLLEQSLGHIHDPKNLQLISEDFFLEKNKSRVQQILSREP